METMERKNQAATVKMERMEGPQEGGRQAAQGSRQRGAQGGSAKEPRRRGGRALGVGSGQGRRAPRGCRASSGGSGRSRTVLREQVTEAECLGAGARGTDGGHRRHRRPRALQRRQRQQVWTQAGSPRPCESQWA